MKDLYTDGIETFERWQAEIILILAERNIDPDEYLIDMADESYWRGLYESGYSAEDAVNITFNDPEE